MGRTSLAHPERAPYPLGLQDSLAVALAVRKSGGVDSDTTAGTSTDTSGDAGAADAIAPGAFNPFEPGFAQDPYPQYAAIRAHGRSQRTMLGALLVSHYEDCFTLLRLPGTSVDDRHANQVIRQPLPPEFEARRDENRRTILDIDPPDHTRLRRLMASAFTVRQVERLRPRVQALVAELLDEIAEAARAGEPVDLIPRFAFPLPFMVISELLGMPEGDRVQLRTWSHTMTKSLEPLVDPNDFGEIVAAGDNMLAHLEAAIEWKRANPADDVLSGLIAAEQDGDRLSPEELIDQVMLVYIAGHETTVNLIGNGTLALLRHRDQLERLAADPALDAPAVDELLRYDSPVQLSRRIVTAETDLAGETVQPGELVLTLLGSANRDEGHWGPTAGDLDLGRGGASAHMSFGGGVHHCLGAALARLEAAEAIPALIRRFPNLELAADEPAWNGRIILRGLDALPVAVQVRPAGSG
jgi:cytochrome P450